MKNAYTILKIARGRTLTDENVRKKYENLIKMLDVSIEYYEKKNKINSAYRDEKGNTITIIEEGKKERTLTNGECIEQQREEAAWAYEQLKDEKSRQQYDEQLKQKQKEKELSKSNKITKLASRYNGALTKQREAIQQLNKSAAKASSESVISNIAAKAQQGKTLDVPTVRGRNIRWDRTKWEGPKREDGEAR